MKYNCGLLWLKPQLQEPQPQGKRVLSCAQPPTVGRILSVALIDTTPLSVLPHTSGGTLSLKGSS